MEKQKIAIVAEISSNHGQNLNRAIKMIRVAKQCGADAVKFQTYTPSTLTLDINRKYFRVHHPKWGGQTLYQLYKKAYTPWSWFKKLKQVAENEGIAFFSTAFDNTSIDFLEELDVFCHKIASFELVDLPLIEYAAQTKKPLILSTGMATLQEIREAVAAAKRGGARDITLLKCVSSYPTDLKTMNLLTISDMKNRFRMPIGLSDHSLGITASVTSVALGAVFIEKHFTLSRKMRTPDTFFSVEPTEFKKLVRAIREAEDALGQVRYGPTEEEKGSRALRRSLFVVENVLRGEKFSKKNVRSIRPAAGLKPKYYDKILDKVAACDIRAGTPLKKSWVT